MVLAEDLRQGNGPQLIGERPAADPWHVKGKKLLDAIAKSRKKKGSNKSP